MGQPRISGIAHTDYAFAFSDHTLSHRILARRWRGRGGWWSGWLLGQADAELGGGDAGGAGGAGDVEVPPLVGDGAETGLAHGVLEQGDIPPDLGIGAGVVAAGALGEFIEAGGHALFAAGGVDEGHIHGEAVAVHGEAVGGRNDPAGIFDGIPQGGMGLGRAPGIEDQDAVALFFEDALGGGEFFHRHGVEQAGHVGGVEGPAGGVGSGAVAQVDADAGDLRGDVDEAVASRLVDDVAIAAKIAAVVGGAAGQRDAGEETEHEVVEPDGLVVHETIGNYRLSGNLNDFGVACETREGL